MPRDAITFDEPVLGVLLLVAPLPSRPPPGSSPPSTSFMSSALRRSASCAPRPRYARSAASAASPIFSVDEGELLERGDDDRRARRQRLRELLAVLVDLLDHALLVLELVDGVLELLVEHAPVGDHDDGVEDPLVLRRRAGSTAGARARRSSCSCRSPPSAGPGSSCPAPSAARRGLQLPHGVELVVAREDDRSPCVTVLPVDLLLFDLQVNEAPEDVEQAVALPDLLPEVARAVAARVLGVARAAVRCLG